MATICPRRLAVSAVVAFSLAAYAMSASAASVPAWHIVHTVTGGSCAASSQFADVSASGPRDGWFVGQECSVGPRPLIQRWTGRGWRTVKPPKAVVSSVNEVGVVSSSSPGNAWVFGFNDNTSSAVGLHWNGAKWTRTNFPAMSGIASAVVFSRTNAWAFGMIASPFRSYVVRYNGTAWHEVSFPLANGGMGEPASAVSATDMWVVGETSGKGSPTANAVAHWNGAKWRTVLLPSSLGPAPGTYQPSGIVAFGPKDVWVDATRTQGQGVGGGGFLLHWNGAKWRQVRVPYPTDSLMAMCQDGHGGVWILAVSSRGTGFKDYLYHDNGGRWSRQLVPTRAGDSTQIPAMSWIPGTRSAWAAGELLLPSGTEAAALRYEP